MGGRRQRPAHPVHQGRVRPGVHPGHRGPTGAAGRALLAARRQEPRAVAGAAERPGAARPAGRTRSPPGPHPRWGTAADLHRQACRPAVDRSARALDRLRREPGAGGGGRARAGRPGSAAIALTDHDTLAGVPEALAAGERFGVRVVAGCEFSAAAPWGEMHVLGYFLPSAARPSWRRSSSAAGPIGSGGPARW